MDWNTRSVYKSRYYSSLITPPVPDPWNPLRAKGKSGGYRVIYYLKTDEGIILATIYSKSDITDVSNETILEVIAQYETEIPSEDNPK